MRSEQPAQLSSSAVEPGKHGSDWGAHYLSDLLWPEYSPSGKKIVYSGQDAPNGDREIYTINAGGGGKNQLTDNATGDYEPNYSPSGKKIAFEGSDGNDSEIYTINAGGGDKVQLTDNNTDDYEPNYSPSGKKIAYSGSDGQDDEIYTINAGGGSKFQRHR